MAVPGLAKRLHWRPNTDWCWQRWESWCRWISCYPIFSITLIRFTLTFMMLWLRLDPASVLSILELPWLLVNLKKCKIFIPLVIVLRYILAPVFWEIKDAAGLELLPRGLVGNFTCKRYKLLSSYWFMQMGLDSGCETIVLPCKPQRRRGKIQHLY